MRLCGKDGKDQQSLHYRTTEFVGVLFGFFANVSFVSLLQSTFHQLGKANATWYSSFKMLTDPHHSYPCCLRPDVTMGVRWQCNRGKELSSAGPAITFSQSFCVVQLNLVAQAASVVLYRLMRPVSGYPCAFWFVYLACLTRLHSDWAPV